MKMIYNLKRKTFVARKDRVLEDTINEHSIKVFEGDEVVAYQEPVLENSDTVLLTIGINEKYDFSKDKATISISKKEFEKFFTESDKVVSAVNGEEGFTAVYEADTNDHKCPKCGTLQKDFNDDCGSCTTATPDTTVVSSTTNTPSAQVGGEADEKNSVKDTTDTAPVTNQKANDDESNGAVKDVEKKDNNTPQVAQKDDINNNVQKDVIKANEETEMEEDKKDLQEMARKISNEMIKAFKNKTNWKSGNTEVKNGAIYLHGNKIVKSEGGKVFISTADWNTVTTRERLNAIPNVSVNVKKGELFLNGEEWDGKWKEIEMSVSESKEKDNEFDLDDEKEFDKKNKVSNLDDEDGDFETERGGKEDFDDFDGESGFGDDGEGEEADEFGDDSEFDLDDGEDEKIKADASSDAKNIINDLDSDVFSDELKDKLATVIDKAIDAEIKKVLKKGKEKIEEKVKSLVKSDKEKRADWIKTERLKINKYMEEAVSEIKEEIQKEQQAKLVIEEAVAIHDKLISFVNDVASKYNITLDDLKESTKLKKELEASNEKNRVLENLNKEIQKKAVISEQLKDVNATSEKRFRKLAESVEFTDIKSYNDSLDILKATMKSEKSLDEDVKDLNKELGKVKLKEDKQQKQTLLKEEIEATDEKIDDKMSIYTTLVAR